MTLGNTAAVFVPNLLRPKEETISIMGDIQASVGLVSSIIALHASLFPEKKPEMGKRQRSRTLSRKLTKASMPAVNPDQSCAATNVYELSAEVTNYFEHETSEYKLDFV